MGIFNKLFGKKKKSKKQRANGIDKTLDKAMKNSETNKAIENVKSFGPYLLVAHFNDLDTAMKVASEIPYVTMDPPYCIDRNGTHTKIIGYQRSDDRSLEYTMITGGDITPDEAQTVDFLFIKYGEDPPFGRQAVSPGGQAPKSLKKCTGCGGTLRFIPKSELAYESLPPQTRLEDPKRAAFECSNCGALIILNKETGDWK